MPNYLVSVVNDEFITNNEEAHADFKTAVEQALKGALEIGVQQILAGRPFTGAVVTVESGSDRERFLVALGVSPLK